MGKDRQRSLFRFAPIMLFIVLALIGGIVAFKRIPRIDQLLPANEAQISLRIIQPASNSRWPMDAYVPIIVTWVSEQPPQAMELWVDGERVRRELAPAWQAGRAGVQRWFWQAASVGRHTLLARLIAADGTIQDSNLLRLTSTDAVGALLAHAVGESETVEDVAVQYGLPVETIIEENELQENGEFLPVGNVVQVPIPLVEPAQDDQTAHPIPPIEFTPAGELGALNQVGLWVVDWLSLQSAPPAAPILSGWVEHCEAHLVIEDQAANESGFFVYQADGNQLAMTRAAELAPASGAVEWSVRLEKEQSVFVVSAFNAAGESRSNLVQLSPDADCLPNPAGELGWVGPDLILPRPVDRAYFYFTSDGIHWDRMPSGSGSFFNPVDGELHISPAMQFELGEAGQKITMEVWGWEGSTLHLLGRTETGNEGQTTLKVCTLGTNCPPDKLSQYWAESDTVGIGEDHNPYRLFAWKTDLSSITGALWQVSQEPFGDEFTFTPEGLLDAGTLDHPVPEGSFEIDFDQLAAQAFSGGDDPAPPVEAKSADENNPYSLNWMVPMYANLKPVPTSDLPLTFYVRITPFIGDQPAGALSNTVVVMYDYKLLPPPEPTFSLDDLYDVEIIEFNDELPMDIARWGCVVVVENYYQPEKLFSMGAGSGPLADEYDPDDPDCHDPQKATCRYQNGEAGYEKFLWYTAGQEICPSHYNAPSDLENLGSAMAGFATGVWDWVAGGIQWLKAQVVEAFVIVLDQVGIECDDTCRQYAEIGLDIAITYFTGIPPNLPNSDEMLDMSLDYAVEMAAAELGVSCDESCQQVIRDTLEEAYEIAATSQGSNACISEDYAHAYGKEPLCLDPLMKTRPVERSTYQPANAVISIRRSVDPPVREGEEEFYLLRLQVDGFNASVVGMPFFVTADYSYVIAAPLAGPLYETVDVQIPALDAGEEIQIPLLLKPTGYIIPNHLESLDAANATNHNEAAIGIYDRYCLKGNGQVIVTLQMMCAGDFMGEWETCHDSQSIELSGGGGFCPNFTGYPPLEGGPKYPSGSGFFSFPEAPQP